MFNSVRPAACGLRPAARGLRQIMNRPLEISRFTCTISGTVHYTSVVQDVARGPKLALWGFLLGPFKKNVL